MSQVNQGEVIFLGNEFHFLHKDLKKVLSALQEGHGEFPIMELEKIVEKVAEKKLLKKKYQQVVSR